MFIYIMVSRLLFLTLACLLFGLLARGEDATDSDYEVLDEDGDDMIQNATLRFATFCTTPNNNKGYCVEVEKCEVFSKEIITPQHPSYDFFVASNCTPKVAKKMKICCGKDDNFKGQILKNQGDDDLLPRDCGKQKLLTFNSRIFGGIAASLGEFPWMGRMVHTRRGLEEYSCSAFLVHERFAVTAAHCLSPSLIQLFGELSYIIFGDHDFSTVIDCADRAQKKCAPQPQKIPVGKLIIHPHYDTTSGNHNNDIAVVQLKKKAILTQFVQPICLAAHPFPQTLFQVSGWGKTKTAEESQIKRKLDLDRFPIDNCIKVYKTRSVAINKKNQLCAGGLKDQDTCTGDSGGPLMVENNQTWYAEGIVSFGIGCGKKGMPGVYTNIPKYLPWVKSVISKRLESAQVRAFEKKKVRAKVATIQ